MNRIPAARGSIALARPDSDAGFRGWGPRVGLSLNPDQIHFGAHLDCGHFARHIRLQPNLELGFGDDVKLFTANIAVGWGAVLLIGTHPSLPCRPQEV